VTARAYSARNFWNFSILCHAIFAWFVFICRARRTEGCACCAHARIPMPLLCTFAGLSLPCLWRVGGAAHPFPTRNSLPVCAAVLFHCSRAFVCGKRTRTHLPAQTAFPHRAWTAFGLLLYSAVLRAAVGLALPWWLRLRGPFLLAARRCLELFQVSTCTMRCLSLRARLPTQHRCPHYTLPPPHAATGLPSQGHRAGGQGHAGDTFCTGFRRWYAFGGAGVCSGRGAPASRLHA